MSVFNFLNSTNGEGQEMGFFDHLEVLRWHIIRSLLAILIITILCFIKYDLLFDKVIFAPLKDSFASYRFLCYISQLTGMKDLCMQIGEIKLTNLQLTGQFMTQMSTALTAGLILAFPYIIWEIWQFVKPGLHEHESKKTTNLILFVSFLFFVGVLFGYFVMTPFSVAFFKSYSISTAIVNNFTLDNYISTLTTTVFSSGLIFELPVLIYFLSKLGITSPEFLKTYRRHAYVIIIILAAVITPQTDLISLALITIPLVLLYEYSINISKKVFRESLMNSTNK